jgi:hypothetical protein
MIATSDPILRRIARFGLPGVPDEIDGDETGRVEPGRWPAVIDGIVRQRLGGHAVRSAGAGALSLSSSQLDELMERHEEQLAIDLRLERMLVDCDTALDRAGVETRVLKGPAIAHRFYEDPSLRSFGDGDILVRGEDFDTTIETLIDAGFVRRFAAPRHAFDRRFVKAVALVAGDGLELDVHRALTPGPFGVLFDADEIFRATPDRIEVGGRQLRCLTPELAFVQACAHAVLGDPAPRFVSLRDIAELTRGHIDTLRTWELFRQFRAEIVAQRAVALVERVLGVALPDEFAQWRQYTGTRADRSRLSSYAGNQPRYAAQAAATFWVLPSMRERVAYASALAFPGRAYLRRHDRSYARRVGRGAALLVRWRPR